MTVILYILVLVVWSGVLAYWLIFRLAMKKESTPSLHTVHDLDERPREVHATQTAVAPAPRPVEVIPPRPSTSRFSSKDGFKSFQTGPELTVDDIVKGLTRD